MLSFRMKILLCWVALIGNLPEAYGWGKDGHCMVASVAAQILASEGRPLFKNHRFDLCYYNNVPDMIWKAPATYDVERYEHYFDLEPVLAQLKKEKKTLKNLPAKRSQIDNSKIQIKWGRAPWRISELYTQLESISKTLKKKAKDHQEHQAQWLVVAGVLGHYIADLAQPLHCTENHDGQLTDQKGLHNYFESSAVSDLLPGLEPKALEKALQSWPKFSRDHRPKSVFDMSLELCQSSMDLVPQVLKMDKEAGRDNPAAFVRASEDLLRDRIAVGAMYLAELWRRQADWSYDGNKFYKFSGQPEYIAPGAPGKAEKKSSAIKAQ